MLRRTPTDRVPPSTAPWQGCSSSMYPPTAGFTLVTTERPEPVWGLRVSSGFFGTLGVRPLLGREFRPDEEGPSRLPQSCSGTPRGRRGSTVALTSCERSVTLQSPSAQRYFPGEESPSVVRSRSRCASSSPARDIVGIVADIKDGPPETPAHPNASGSFDQAGFSLVVRTQQPEPALVPSLLAAVHEIRAARSRQPRHGICSGRHGVSRSISDR